MMVKEKIQYILNQRKGTLYFESKERHVGDVNYNIIQYVEDFWLDSYLQNSVIIGNYLDNMITVAGTFMG